MGEELQNLYYDYANNEIKHVDDKSNYTNGNCATEFNSDIADCTLKNMFNMNSCLTNTIDRYKTIVDLSYNTSTTRKQNWVSLYNEQYIENIELGVGILVISIILAKMMFFPIKMKI
jgi:hypothetical protein